MYEPTAMHHVGAVQATPCKVLWVPAAGTDVTVKGGEFFAFEAVAGGPGSAWRVVSTAAAAPRAITAAQTTPIEIVARLGDNPLALTRIASVTTQRSAPRKI
jgi:hypothetical protein